MKTFLLIDDHFVVRSGLKGMLFQIYPSCDVQEAENAEIAIQQLKKKTFDLVIMDIQVPGSNMLEVMKYLRVRYPETKVLVFSMSAEHLYAERFLKAGAMGFVPKDALPDIIIAAIDRVLHNRKFISETLAESIAKEINNDNGKKPFHKLSTREFEIADLLLSGRTLSEIAAILHLQLSTIGTHKARIFKKLGVTNLLELKELAQSYSS